MKTTKRVLAAGALVAVAVSAAPMGAAAGSHASAAPAAVKAGVKQRAEIPWSQVGIGWVAATVQKDGAHHLILVSPAGQSYEITTVQSSDRVLLVSGSGRHALLDTGVYDLRTGKRVMPYVHALSFTTPTGSSLLALDASNRLVKYDMTGKIVQRGAQVGDVERALYSPDGRTFLLTVGSKVTVFDNGTLQPIRTLANPKGFTQCKASHFAVREFTEICTGPGKTPTGFVNTIAGKLSGPMTKGTAGTSGREYQEAWLTELGFVARPRTRGLHEPINGSANQLYSFLDGTFNRSWKAPVANDPQVKALWNDFAYLETQRNEPTPTIVIGWPVGADAGRLVHYAGPGSQYGGTPTEFQVVGL